MDPRKIILHETGTVAVGLVLCGAVMVGIFALLGYYDTSVLLGTVVGSVLSLANFFVMAMSTSLAADRAQEQDIKGGQAMIQLSYMGRMIALLVVLVLCAGSGRFHLLALVLPLAFVRPILTAVEFLKKKGGKEA